MPQDPTTGNTNQQVLDQAQAVGDRAVALLGDAFDPSTGFVPSTPIPSPVPATDLTPNNSVSLPEPQAAETQEAAFNSIAGDAEIKRAALDESLKNQKADVDGRIATLQDERQTLLATQQDLTDPFREDLENAERERLFINENFEANQKLINELDSLLTEGNELINISKGRAVANTVLNKSVNKTMSDVLGRAGVIESVIAARSGQIAEAQRLIDRSVNAISADRRDQIAYYDTLLQLNNQDLLNLDAESKGIAAEQLSLAKQDLARAQETADYVKGLMISPATAKFMADAGVTLNDSVSDIKSKMSEQAKRDEIANFTNQLVEAGYDVSPVKVPGGTEYKVGGQKVYASVRPGSQLDLKLQADRNALVTQSLQQQNLRSQIAARAASQRAVGTNGTIDGKPQTNSQAVAGSYANRLLEAERILSVVNDEFAGDFAFGGVLPNQLKSDERQQFEQARRNFINAVLRRESGAVIAESEFENAEKQYFAQPGDSPEVLRQKAENRNTVINNFYAEANVLRPTAPGDIIVSDGVRYEVGADGDTLTPLNTVEAPDVATSNTSTQAVRL